MPLKLGRNNRYTTDKLFTAHIKLLDNTIIDINLPRSAKGKECLERISSKLGLHEIDFFGLQYLTRKEKLHWVDLDKCLRKQLDRHAAHKGRDAMLVFRVQYFAITTDVMQQEITRYLFYLQLKSLIILGKLYCEAPIALKLAGLAVQAEFGDHDYLTHTTEYLSDFHLLPNSYLDNGNIQQYYKEIVDYHKENRGLTPANAEKKYIEVCQKLNQYGIDLLLGKDKDGSLVEIGACYHGIRILSHDSMRRGDSLLSWQDVGKMVFNRQKFVVSNINTGESYTLHMEDMDTAKHLWKLCVGQHQFFRVSHNTVGRKMFRTQFEMATDPTLFIKMQQQTPIIKRKMTLTKRKAKDKQLTTKVDHVNHLPTNHGTNGVVQYPIHDDTMDDSEFLHRYEDICNLEREQRSSLSSSANSTPASSEYNTSDSDSECDFRQFQVQQSPQGGEASDTRPHSLIFTRLTRIGREHRDEMLRHIEELLSSGNLQNDFEQVFIKKSDGEFTVGMDNMNSNRIGDVLPYNDNRIQLNASNNFEATSYINATPIQMTIKDKHNMSFIVTQSPLKHTVNTFWQMVWEQNVTVIAMLSKLKEKGHDKCFQYWPESSDKTSTSFGQINVKKNFESNFAAYSIQSFHVQHSAYTQSRTVLHIQYLQWPEDGHVPMWTQPFIEFLDEIQSIRKVAKDINKGLAHPQILVHCEDGAARSGVVVLAEVLLASMEYNELLDIPITLAQLRSQRMKLVQTLQEYTFVHQLLADYLKRNRLI